MDWQTAGVVVIVIGAVVFLARKLFVRPRRKTGATAFIPLGSLKKKKKKDDHCH